MLYVPFSQSLLYPFTFTSGLKGYSLIRKTNGANVKTYCILCLSRGQAGQSSPLQNSEWQLSTWSHCCHILCIQSGNRSANNHRNKPLLEPVLMGQLCFLHHPQTACKADSEVSSLLGSHSYPLPFTPSRALCFVLFCFIKNYQARQWVGVEDRMRDSQCTEAVTTDL